jgi:high affinity Mn2+ porin
MASDPIHSSRLFPLLLAALLSATALAQSPGPATLPAAEKPRTEAGEKPFKPELFSFHLQSTVTPQGYPGFHADYSGPNSLPNGAELRTSYSATLFLGARLWHGAAFYVDPEMFGGIGVGRGFGVAGFPNGDVNRVSTAHPTIYLARAFVRQTLGFGGDTENIEADQNQLAETVDVSRLTLTLGKFSAADVFDSNAYAHDPRTQFLNWSLFDNGAWDYPADIRGYTYGGSVELNQAKWALRYGIFMEPSVASGSHLSYDIGEHFGQVAEFEQRYALGSRPGKVRLLAYWNRADMGDYTKAARMAEPDITRTRATSSKYGVGLNLEQQVSDDMGLFARLGWQDGRREDWAFTEIDRTATVGLSQKGTPWSRPDDIAGLALSVNGLSDPHRRYLENGGLGFILGDGRLHYDAEEIVETYYSAKLTKYFFLTADVQFINHPAYNRDRGPVWVGTLRLHLQI